MGLGIGPRLHSECPFSSIADEYASTGQVALQVAVEGAYRQVFEICDPVNRNDALNLNQS